MLIQSLKKTTRGAFLSLILFASLLASGALAADPGIRFCDSAFEGGWSATKVFDTTSGKTAKYKAYYVPNGGASGPYRQTEHDWGTGAIGVGHLFTAAVYDPSTQGPLASVRYQYTLRHFTASDPGGAVGYRILLLQNGVYYVGPLDEIYDNVWKNFPSSSSSPLTANDFNKLDAGSTGPAHPNFSCTGGKMTFGYATVNSHTTPNTNQKKVSGIDNWCVFLTQDACASNLNADFSLTATVQSGNPNTFTLAAVPAQTACKFWWKVEHFDTGSGQWVTDLENPPIWWNSPYITSNDFSSMGGKSPGAFKQGVKYRITRGVWADGCAYTWKAVSKTVEMCTGCRSAKIERTLTEVPRPNNIN